MIAQTILQQMGGHRFALTTGSKDFIGLGNGLLMSLSRNKTSANRLEIIYDEGLDLYNMRFYRKTFSKRPSKARRKTSPNTRGYISICWRKSLQR